MLFSSNTLFWSSLLIILIRLITLITAASGHLSSLSLILTAFILGRYDGPALERRELRQEEAWLDGVERPSSSQALLVSHL